ncbi:MAG TPA: tetratricopeptide repeat protein [Aggregatilineaceae bacterium]|nr:tetratricopeptide repeat protein [Aggregatilineaceae bacterium]
MAGNRHIYEQAMNVGHSAAWDQHWDRAIAAYGRAVQEFPDDPGAHNSLGLALLQARRLEDALKVYTRAHQLAPDDTIPLEKSADVLERLGRLKEAAQQYINVAELYLAQRDLEKAIANWERATQLTSGLVQIHQRLALAYERTGQRRAAIREYLSLAFTFQRADRPDIATQAVERALRLEPSHPQALNTLQALKTGQLISPDVLEGDTPAVAARRERAFDAAALEEDSATGEDDPRGPLGEAMEFGLAALAAAVFDTGDLTDGGTQVLEAIECQRVDDVEAAIGAYQRALKAGFHHPGIFINLGVLLLDVGEWKEAVRSLDEAGKDPLLAPGAMQGLSMAHFVQRNHRAAAYYLIQTLRLVDIGLAQRPDEAAQLGTIYDRLTAGIEGADDQQLRRMNERFLELLTGANWKQRIAKTRRQLEEAITLEEPESLISIVPYINDRVTEGLNSVDEYLRDGLLMLAMDQAHFLLESAPDYLPIHWRIGQILLERDNIQEAIVKYDLVANVYLMRGDMERAAEILQEALKIAPMDVKLHRSLIDLLQNQERWAEVLNQHIDLADAYYQLGDLEAARATYHAAIQLAERVEAPAERMVHILHRLGDIDVSVFDLRQAMRTYEQIRKLDPADERARRMLVDLNYRLNDPISAVRELDGLLRVYAREHRAGQIIKVLEEQVTRYPQDMALRSRLAAVYRQTGSLTQAVEQLDSLAELQLEAGLHNDALVTIRRIIALNPRNVDDYRRLLRQLSG